MRRAWLAAVLLISCELPSSTPTPTPTGPSVRMIAIDVGQGDATLIIGPDGTVVLIDGGGLGEVEAVRAAITEHARGRVDHVVVTHYDADHLAGVADYLLGSDRQAGTADDGAPNAILWDYGDDGDCDTQTCDRFRLSRTGRARVMVPGDEITMGDARLTCVAVNGSVSDGAMVLPSDENARSIALLLSYGEFRALFAGDLTGGGDGTSNVEPLVASVTGPVDLLKVNHHGSRTSSNELALQRWAPRAGLISVGSNNSYCHPAREVLTRLSGLGMRIFATGSGITAPTSRCDEATDWPAGAAFGMGTVEAVAAPDRSLFIAGEEIP